MFSGSYLAEDVTFLLKPVRLPHTEVQEKERMIQLGRHYSEMISYETLPKPEYLQLFYEAMKTETTRFAGHLLAMAECLANRGKNTIVSLARAGTPIGVLLVRSLRRLYKIEARHYSISIIRDRGIDENAVRYLVDRFSPESLAFVDGWSAKGIIAEELRKSLDEFRKRCGIRLDPMLYVVVDLGGNAGWSASMDDYLVPSSLLGATISGLVSRSILNEAVIGPADFHGCLYYHEFLPNDLSRWFVDQVFTEMQRLWVMGGGCQVVVDSLMKRERQRQMLHWIDRWSARHGVRDVNLLKPGIGEATRALLRRIPDRIVVRDRTTPSVQHLLQLSEAKDIHVDEDAHIPFQAVAVIRSMEG